jgi:hypothetical protein
MLFDNEVLSSNFSWLSLNKSQLKLELKTFLSKLFCPNVLRFDLVISKGGGLWRELTEIF